MNKILSVTYLLGIVVLLSGCVSQDLPSAPIMDVSRSTRSAPDTYRVHLGDTLYSIAWAYRLDYRKLIAMNAIKPPYLLHVGQLIRIKARPSDVKLAKKIQKRPVRVRVMVKKWRWPAKGRVISRFSQKPFGNKGINVSSYLGAPVRSAASGVVVYSGAGVRGYGNLILIKHNDDYLSAYAFNRQNLTKEGDKVLSGQRIALMGQDDSGRIMLHFEIRRDGAPVNPMRYLH